MDVAAITSGLDAMALKSCASCGKSSDALKKCASCKCVWYCNVECQKAHRKVHKKACKRVGRQLRLFADPPPREECAICMTTLPLVVEMSSFAGCCGAMICVPCDVTQTAESMKAGLVPACPFCRRPYIEEDELLLARYRERAEKGDARALRNLSRYYMEGLHGCPVDPKEAFELLVQAANKQDAEACHDLACAYHSIETAAKGYGIDQDMAKAREYYELGAMAGSARARCNLGSLEAQSGNFPLAILHWRIAAAAGSKFCVDKLDAFCELGLISRDEVEQSRRAWKKTALTMWSEDRDEYINYLKKQGKFNEKSFSEYAFGIGSG